MSWAFLAGVGLAIGTLAYALYPLVVPRRSRVDRAAAKVGAPRTVTDEEIEAAVRAFRATHALGGAPCPVCGPRPESDAVFCSTCGRQLDVTAQGS